MNTNKENNENEEDIVFEEDETASSFKVPKIDKLKKKLAVCEAEKKEYLSGWQKARADLVNLRKQDEQEKNEAKKRAAEAIIEDILPILDSFEMAMGNKDSWESVSKEWRQGVEYIHQQLAKTLQEHGLIEIIPKNETFDPSRHEAVETIPGKDNIVVDVAQKGYELHGKVLRTAKVKVGNGE